MQRQWSELTTGQRTGIVAAGALEVALTLTAAVDLVRRPAEQVRGPKLVWWPLLLVQPVGPVGYLLLGRRSD